VYEIKLILAGVPFDVRVEGPCNPSNIEARFGAYRRDRYASEARSPAVTANVTPSLGWRCPREVVAPYPGADVEMLDGGGARFYRYSDVITWDPRARSVRSDCMHVEKDLPPLVDATPVDTPLRLALSCDLPSQQGLLTHGAGYGDARGAVVFLAPTRGGKTTTSRKLPEANVLSDDQVALRCIDGAWWAYALPFVGDFAKATVPREVPLRALVLLEKSETVTCTRVSEARALARVLNCVVRFTRGAGGGELLALAGDLVAKTPVYTLALSLHEPVMPFVERML
jgi:hypothetical protein